MIHTNTPPNAQIAIIREAFATHLLTALAAADRLAAADTRKAAVDPLRDSLRGMREAFNQMAALAGPRVLEIAAADNLGRELPNWEVLNRANPLVDGYLIDTVRLVLTYLEGVAFAIEQVKGDGLPHGLGVGLAQNVQVAIAALRLHVGSSR